jgi:bifunctional UDP-N-acetylglucosamine pyrophosphorylase/glucosamine-1-phosphate N-acetyltransferase
MRNGVQIMDSDTTWIDDSVEIGCDSVILPGTILRGNTRIGEECLIGQNTRIDDSVVSDRTTVEQSVLRDCTVGRNCRIGPFSHIRPESILGDNVTIGAYVEVKNSTIGDYSRARHLTYIGDAQVGKNVNFGCGTVTCNYDGMDKSACVIKDNVFIGGNSNLISPVTLSENSYIAAGSTITEDVPELSLAIARAQQINKENWVVKKNRLRSAKLIQPDRRREGV